MIQELLESDSDDPEQPFLNTKSRQIPSKIVGSHKKKRFSRLSQLSKLNLLGLIDLALIACDLKLT